MEQSNNWIVLSFSAGSGHTYRVEFKHDLVAPMWTLLTAQTATASSVTITDATSSQPRRYYRVTLLP